MRLSDSIIETAVAVSDLPRARRFYEQQLGLTPGEEEEGISVRYGCGGGTRLFIYLAPENAGSATGTVAGWFVDDLEAALDELGGRGIAFERYDMPGLRTDDRGVFDAGRFRAAWMRDPDGNTFALTQRAILT